MKLWENFVIIERNFSRCCYEKEKNSHSAKIYNNIDKLILNIWNEGEKKANLSYLRLVIMKFICGKKKNIRDNAWRISILYIQVKSFNIEKFQLEMV